MLRPPTQVFPAAASQQRLSGGTSRNKVRLKPGRSLMDWIRLTKSGKDLTGLKGRLIEVSEEELAKHNKKDDCWICIRGMVYNLTPYLEYHPGGEEELMKGAGIDGTELFDQIHRWVNYDSMLKECLIGRMALKPASIKAYFVKRFETPRRSTRHHIKFSDRSCVKMSKRTLLNGASVPDGGFKKTLRDVSPRHEWFQTEDAVTVVIYTKQKDISSDSMIIDLTEGVLRTEVHLEESYYVFHMKLNHDVQEVVSVHYANTVGKIELCMKKTHNTMWSDLGLPLENHDSQKKKSEGGLFYRKCKLLSKTDVTHDTRLLCFQLPPGCHLKVPTGQHIYLKNSIHGTEVVRPYTAILPSLYPEPEDHSHIPTNIYLMIKIYPHGIFTPSIDSLQIGDSVSVSNPESSFRSSQMKGKAELLLLAAGTGFTPMISVIRFALKESSCLRKVRLIFFNKKEEDILWRDQLDHLSSKDNRSLNVGSCQPVARALLYSECVPPGESIYSRFEVEYILSEPHTEWTGKRGRIEMSHCSELRSKCTEESKMLVCVCGPASFTELALCFLKQIGFSDEEIHAFNG